jgi:hypothetical protein
VLFNTAAPAVGIWIASQAFVAVAGTQVSSTARSRAAALRAARSLQHPQLRDQHGLVAAAMGLDADKSPVAIWKEHFPRAVAHLSGRHLRLDADARALARLARPADAPLEVLLLITPLPVILYVTFMHAVGRAQDQIEHLGGMNRVYVATIEALAQTIDAKDQVTHDHIRRVQDNSVRPARTRSASRRGEIQGAQGRPRCCTTSARSACLSTSSTSRGD